MEYLALFVWFSLALLLGSLVQSVMNGAARYRIVAALVMPGVVVRKLSQAAAALVCGARVTDCRLYDPNPRDTHYSCTGVSTVAKVLVPLAPLFGCILAFGVLSGALGSPLTLDFGPPRIPTLGLRGLQAFAADAGSMASGLLRRLGSTAGAGGYVMVVLAFSLALGSCHPVERLKQALLGTAGLLAGLAVLEGVAGAVRLPGAVRSALNISSAQAFFEGVRVGLVDWAGRALSLVGLGLGLSLVAGLLVRIYELAAGKEGSGNTGAGSRAV